MTLRNITPEMREAALEKANQIPFRWTKDREGLKYLPLVYSAVTGSYNYWTETFHARIRNYYIVSSTELIQIL